MNKPNFEIQSWPFLENLIKEKNYTAIFVLCDRNTHQHCLAHLKQQMSFKHVDIFIVEGGEGSKSLKDCELIWSHWIQAGIDRKSLIICLGGGVICDLGGFCASNILRGVDFVLIPTSLMAMADAAFGGKTGINFRGLKNQIGNFSIPEAVVIDLVFLATLPPRHWKNGFVEMIKHGLLDPDPYWLDLNMKSIPIDGNKVEALLKRSIGTKHYFVEGDFKEAGKRKALNFGHTIGHAIESELLDSGIDILHGEAIAIGMICEAWLSARLYSWPEGLLEKVVDTLKPFCLRVDFDEKLKEAIVFRIAFDKKRHARKNQFILLQRPGVFAINIELKDDDIAKSLEFYLD